MADSNKNKADLTATRGGGKHMDRISNFFALAKMIKETKYEWADGIFTIGSLGSRLSIDTINNIASIEKDDDWVQIAMGTKKSNGYLYAPLNFKDGWTLMGIHTIVCMLVNGIPENYSIVNHKDNCPWNNAPANLEWVDLGGNNLHGRVVKSINKHFPDVYTHLEKRGNGVHIILDTPLSVQDIEKYLAFKPDGYFSIKRYEDYISKDKIADFIKWLGW